MYIEQEFFWLKLHLGNVPSQTLKIPNLLCELHLTKKLNRIIYRICQTKVNENVKCYIFYLQKTLFSLPYKKFINLTKLILYLKM
jgi:hypothetical protein